MSTGRAPDFHQWLTRIHGFKVGTSRNSYTVADLEAAWNAAERAWMEVANKNAQERNAAVDREVVLLEALRDVVKWCNGENQVDDGEDAEDALVYIEKLAEAAIKQAERT